jgi:hypothetical protein
MDNVIIQITSVFGVARDFWYDKNKDQTLPDNSMH